jgi:hypothetical protein
VGGEQGIPGMKHGVPSQASDGRNNADQCDPAKARG